MCNLKLVKYILIVFQVIKIAFIIYIFGRIPFLNDKKPQEIDPEKHEFQLLFYMILFVIELPHSTLLYGISIELSMSNSILKN